VSRSVVLDTDDTLFSASGQANLSKETLDFVVRPQPKDRSILSLRTPLVIGGTFAAPTARLEAGSLATRGVAALGLGALNPLLALAATVETGPGADADCEAVLAEAKRPSAGEAAAGAAKARKQ
jgi:AsmA family protein